MWLIISRTCCKKRNNIVLLIPMARKEDTAIRQHMEAYIKQAE